MKKTLLLVAAFALLATSASARLSHGECQKKYKGDKAGIANCIQKGN